MVLGKEWDKAVLVELSPESGETHYIYSCGHETRHDGSGANVRVAIVIFSAGNLEKL